jgi:hypothetical protein
VDAVEGVTHALRDRQYIDRDPMFEYFQSVMGLREVKIWEFSRLNFKQTVLSKRKIQWFVDQGLVTGWDDPRVPTIQGIARSGLQIEALKEFIMSQGASKNITNQTWDKVWTINKKHIDGVVPRYTALESAGLVTLTVLDGPKEVQYKRVPRHQKNPELGNKVTRFYKTVLLEQADAASVPAPEEVTLMAWGNVKLSKVGAAMEGTTNPEGDKKKTKKFTWLADTPDNIAVKLVYLDYLVSEDFDDATGDDPRDFMSFVNKETWREVDALADANVRNVKKGESVQFERKGYFICDRPYLSEARPAVFFYIPDGRMTDAQKAKMAETTRKAQADRKGVQDKRDAKGAAKGGGGAAQAKGKGKKPAGPKGGTQAPAKAEEVKEVRAPGVKPCAVKAGEKFYLTTAINYTNGAPHMGHAYEAVTSDVIARYHRGYGREVFFLTGTGAPRPWRGPVYPMLGLCGIAPLLGLLHIVMCAFFFRRARSEDRRHRREHDAGAPRRPAGPPRVFTFGCSHHVDVAPTVAESVARVALNARRWRSWWHLRRRMPPRRGSPTCATAPPRCRASPRRC